MSRRGKYGHGIGKRAITGGTMNREIFESLERSPLDTEEISKIHEKVVACIDLGGSIINEVSEMCEDQQCHTAFYVIFKYQGES